MALDLRGELAATARLGLPLALGELGWMSTYIVDALLVGRLADSASAIAASSLGNTIFYALAFFVISALNGLETRIAQAFGRGAKQECVRLLVQGFWIVVVGTPLVIASTLGAVRLLPHLGTPDAITVETGRYLRALVWSTPPLMAYMVLRRWLQSINRVALVTVSLVTASLVNLVADWAFLFGHLGIPAMGVAGSAWATCVVRVYMLLMLVLGAAHAFSADGLRLEARMLAPSGSRLKSLLGLGWPSAVESVTELGVSTCLSLLCARLGTVLLAAHQVVLDLSAFAYQAPAGLSYATVARVGQSAGRKSEAQVQRATNASLWLGLVYAVVTASVLAALSRPLAAFYTNSTDVVTDAAPILALCAISLISDTLFVIIASALTGVGDTRTPMVVSLIWSWGIGMPMAYMLAFRLGHGLSGLWFGRVVGSVGAGLTLLACWRRRLTRVARIV